MKLVRINQDTKEVFWDEYFEYLRSEKNRFPEGVYKYAIDWNNYSLEDRNSLHDSWIEMVELKGLSSQFDNVVVTMLGSYHDRRHELTYIEVTKIEYQLEDANKPGSRDLLAHEFRMHNDRVVHEMSFSNSGFLSIEFRDLSIVHKLFDNNL